jgi:hypothetical protein
MTTDQIETVISDTVRRYAKVKGIEAPITIDGKVRPYYDLSMDSLHDVNISCEVQVILGIELPANQKLLARGDRALSIRQAAEIVAQYVNQSASATHA